MEIKKEDKDVSKDASIKNLQRMLEPSKEEIEKVKAEIKNLSNGAAVSQLLNYIEYDYLEYSSHPEPERLDKLIAIRDLAKVMGSDVARAYLDAIISNMFVKEYINGQSVPYPDVYEVPNSNAVDKLLSKEVMEFVRDLGSAALSYLGAVSSIGVAFSRIGESEALDNLLSTEIKEFARDIGRTAAYEYFYAIRKWCVYLDLINTEVIEFAKDIGRTAAYEYFRMIRETDDRHDATILASKEVRDAAAKAIKAIGNTSAVCAYFHALRDRKNINDLSNDIEALAKDLVNNK